MFFLEIFEVLCSFTAHFLKHASGGDNSCVYGLLKLYNQGVRLFCEK